MIRISVPDVGLAEEALVLEVLRSGHLAQGPKVEQLESATAAMAGTAHAIAVSNGTVALIAALSALGIGEGDEVITSPFTFVATLNAILAVGATAVFADVDDDYNLDPRAADAAVTSRTVALMPVHLYGLPADMSGMIDVAQRHGLAVIEDAAQAHGATVDGRSVGSFGVACFSLYATKNITSGEGGVVTTDDADVADRLRLLRNQGMRARYQYEIIGQNLRMTDLQAAVAIPQFARLREINQRRAANAERLSSLLDDVHGIRLPRVPNGRTHVFHQYTAAVAETGPHDRDQLTSMLGQRGVEAGVYYPRLVHDYAPFVDHPGVVVSDTPAAARAARTVFSLPVHPRLMDGEIDLVAEAVRSVVGA